MAKGKEKPNKSTRDDHGTLYVVSTPIGNLEDITLRALRILKSVDLIAAENTTHTRVLCRHYGIKRKLTSYNQHNQKRKAPQLLNLVKSGDDLAIVTDAGTPGISDPGIFLIQMALEQNIRVSPVPGPSAVTASLSVAGLPTDSFLFLGFLSNKGGKRRRELRELAHEHRTMVFYEAPHRIKAFLIDLLEIFGDRQIVMVREMTKVFEEVKRGPISEIIEHLSPESAKGEFTLVIRGRERLKKGMPLSKDVLEKIDTSLINGKQSLKDLAEQISNEEGLAYRKIYKECLSRKKVLSAVES